MWSDARSDNPAGRWIVVLLTMTPSTPPLARTAAAMSATSDSDRSGAILRSNFGLWPGALVPVTSSRTAVTPMRSSWSSVRLCKPLWQYEGLVQTSNNLK